MSYSIKNTTTHDIFIIVYNDQAPPAAYGKLSPRSEMVTHYKSKEVFHDEIKYLARIKELGIEREDI